ncbi:biotin/lipoyl-containing protein [Erysipelothrix urinaevulpis]|uniref:biotin/lipoyl-containing protein n=1 Tax=Erysipelothrix urinaevulpis TaxID=2683717 RepID=UPI0013579971|nr:biotin/lipoyl-containing protein [Erysipelothrix urinaevulpis]
MRKFNINVNGTMYEVDVEEVGGDAPVRPSVQAAKPAPKAATPKKQTPKAAVVEGQVDIKSPMPGSIFKINVSENETVEAGQVLLILEAMKMENEIVAPQAGTVSKIMVNEGVSVNTGDQLVIIE